MKTSLNNLTAESLRRIVNGQRTSNRFTSVAHRADVATQPEPVDEAGTESTDPAETTPAAPVDGNSLIRHLSGRA